MNSLHISPESSHAKPDWFSIYHYAALISQAHLHRAELLSAAARLQAARLSLQTRPNPDTIIDAKAAVLKTLALLRTLVPIRGLQPKFECYVEARLADRQSVVGLNGCLLRLQCVLRALEPMTFSTRVCDLFSHKLAYFRTLFRLCY
jgi:hypothetical protein